MPLHGQESLVYYLLQWWYLLLIPATSTSYCCCLMKSANSGNLKLVPFFFFSTLLSDVQRLRFVRLHQRSDPNYSFDFVGKKNHGISCSRIPIVMSSRNATPSLSLAHYLSRYHSKDGNQILPIVHIVCVIFFLSITPK